MLVCCRAEQLAIAQSKEESMAPKALSDKKLQRRGSLGGSLRRAKKMFTSQDKLDEQSFGESLFAFFIIAVLFIIRGNRKNRTLHHKLRELRGNPVS